MNFKHANTRANKQPTWPQAKTYAHTHTTHTHPSATHISCVTALIERNSKQFSTLVCTRVAKLRAVYWKLVYTSLK